MRVGQFDPSRGSLNTLSRSRLGLTADTPVQGHFGKLGCRRALLYRHRGALLLRVGKQEVDLDDRTQVELERGWWHNVVRVVRAGRVLVRAPYRRPWIFPPLAWDPTAFVEEEHFDFGLFVHNVASDPARRERMYRVTTR
jgi:hypothetical protein